MNIGRITLLNDDKKKKTTTLFKLIIETYIVVNGHLDSEEVWLAGTDMLQEGTWIWADSMKPVVYTHWAPDEPNNDKGQHCMGMWTSRGFLWDDYYCDLKSYPLCKKMYV